MDFNEFQKRAREIVDHDDHYENEDILELVPPEYYKDYLSALALGYKMKPCFSGLSKAIELSKQLHVSIGEVFQLLSHFLHLNKILKGNEDVSDPVADVIDVIDNSTSYQELNFIREHLEYRMMTYLKSLQPTSKALSESWLKKRCPACGYENHIYNTACQTCGWQPIE